MKKLNILLILMLSFGNLYSEWKLVDVAETSMQYWDLDCTDNMYCFAVGNSGGTESSYTKTTDGGYTWEIVFRDKTEEIYDEEGNLVESILPIYNPVKCIDYITRDFAVAGHKEGQITITRDGGLTWDSTQLGTDKNIIGIAFMDSLNGAALSYNNIFITDNAGITWQDVTSNIKISEGKLDMRFLQYSKNDIIHISGYLYADKIYIIKLFSTDKGQTWVANYDYDFTAMQSIRGMHFHNKDLGWIVGRTTATTDPPTYRNIIYQTTDAGENWELQLDTLLSDAPVGLYGIYFADESEGLAWGENGIIWRTNNGGEDWIRDKSYPFPTGDHFRDLAFPEGHTNKILANVYVFRQIWMYEKGTSVKSNEEEKSFNIYPNPVQDYLQINPPQSPFGKGGSELASRGISEIEIYNVLGEKVNDLSPALSYEERGLKIDVSHLTPGVYFIKIGDKVEKFVKE